VRIIRAIGRNGRLVVSFRVALEAHELLAAEGGDFEEAFMKLRLQPVFGALLLFGFVSCALAQEKTHDSTNISLPETRRPALTGKERLGPKWTDEQRIDNCHVPVDKRGTKPRSSTCPNNPSS